MKRLINIIFIFVITVFMFIPSVNASDVLSLNTSEENGNIIVSGETEVGCLAVAVTVYNEDGSKFIKMTTTSVDSNNKYNASLLVDNGTYLVKVADYNGGNYITKTVKVTTNPNTGDNIIIYIVIGIMSLFIVGFGVYYTRKNN